MQLHEDQPIANGPNHKPAMLNISSSALALRVLNTLPKNQDAATPFGDIAFVRVHGGWWAECTVNGDGHWFKTLSGAVRSFRVKLRLQEGQIIGRPLPRQR